MSTMNETERIYEELKALTYGIEFRNTKNIFVFIEKVIKDDLAKTFKSEESKKALEEQIISTLISISREIIEEIKESTRNIYLANDILLYHDKILCETSDFVGKSEVLKLFYEAYLTELSFEAKMETQYCRDMNSLLDLFNNPRYKEVKIASIRPALSDKAAEMLSLDDLKFKNIEEATQAYEKDGSLETLAQLKKLYMIEAVKNTENCYDHEELGKMLNENNFSCVQRIIIKRLAYLDVKNS